MSKLKVLIRDYDITSCSNEKKKIHYILEMVEYSLLYPSPACISDEELEMVGKRIQDLDNWTDNKRLSEIIRRLWAKREHILEIAERSACIEDDFMDAIHYHEEIAKLRRVKNELLQGMS